MDLNPCFGHSCFCWRNLSYFSYLFSFVMFEFPPFGTLSFFEQSRMLFVHTHWLLGFGWYQILSIHFGFHLPFKYKARTLTYPYAPCIRHRICGLLTQETNKKLFTLRFSICTVEGAVLSTTKILESNETKCWWQYNINWWQNKILEWEPRMWCSAKYMEADTLELTILSFASKDNNGAQKLG